MGEGPIFNVAVNTWIWFGFGWQRLGPAFPIEICFYLPFFCFSFELKKKTEKNKWFGFHVFDKTYL